MPLLTPDTTDTHNPVAEDDEADLQRRKGLLSKLRDSTTGLDTTYLLANGETRRRIYLDSTASCLQVGLVDVITRQFLRHYANTHSDLHFGARITNHEYRWAHQVVLDFCNADNRKYGCFFIGSGATAGLNRIAASMASSRPRRDVVITSAMEHHSNDLPHRKHFDHVVHVPTVISEQGAGAVDLEAIENALKEYGERVNYVAVTGVSNVTGIINPVYDIAELAHRHDTLIVVDAAQMAGHIPIRMSGHDNPGRDLDLVAMSGHKLYTPASPGVVVTRLALFDGTDPDEVGGGMVDDVYLDRSMTTAKFPDREEAGTPNIAGAIALGALLYALQRIGMPLIFDQERALLNYAVERLARIDGVVVYGSTDTRRYPRAGAVSINIRGMHHALVAVILNDYFNIAVRNGCFCAHPYVREMVSEDLMKQLEGDVAELSNQQLEALADMHRGMVRASFGLYNNRDDVDYLVDALADIARNRDAYEAAYEYMGDEEFRHRTFRFNNTDVYATTAAVDRWLDDAGQD